MTRDYGAFSVQPGLGENTICHFEVSVIYSPQRLTIITRKERKNIKSKDVDTDAQERLREIEDIASKYIQHVALHHANTSSRKPDEKSSTNAWESASRKLAAKIPDFWGKYHLKADRASGLDSRANEVAIIARKRIKTFVEKGKSAQTKLLFADESDGEVNSRTYEVTNTTSSEALAALVMLSQKARGRKHVANLDFYDVDASGKKEPKELWDKLPGTLLAVMDRGWFRFNVQDPIFPSLYRNIFRIREGGEDMVYLRASLGTLYRYSGMGTMPWMLNLETSDGHKLKACSRWVELLTKKNRWVATESTAVSKNDTRQDMADQLAATQPNETNKSPGNNSLPSQEAPLKSAVHPPLYRIPPSNASLRTAASPDSFGSALIYTTPNMGLDRPTSAHPGTSFSTVSSQSHASHPSPPPSNVANKKKEGWVRRVIKKVFRIT